MREAAICGDYFASQQWDNALRNCDQALELNENANETRYLRGRILYEMERYPDALEELDRVLAVNGFHEEALQLAGYIAKSSRIRVESTTVATLSSILAMPQFVCGLLMTLHRRVTP